MDFTGQTMASRWFCCMEGQYSHDLKPFEGAVGRLESGELYRDISVMTNKMVDYSLDSYS